MRQALYLPDKEMYKEVLRSIGGIEIFPVIGILIFFSFFVLMFWYVWSMGKEELQQRSSMPLDLQPEVSEGVGPKEQTTTTTT